MTSYSRIILQLTVVLIVLSAGGLLYSQWPSLLHVSAKLQKELNVEMAVLIQKVVSDPLKAGGLLTLFSFLYGLLHALGPGHGKVILSAYIATHPAKLRHSALLSILASLLQGTVAVVLVSVVLFILNLSVRQLNNVSQITEKASYAFIILFGAIIVIRALRHLFIRPPVNKPQIKTIRVSDNKPPVALKPVYLQSGQIQTCSCGHQHVMPGNTVTGNWRTQAGMILAMGSRPCSGALLVLLFSSVIGVFHWGIIAVFAMALGTGITLCMIAWFVHSMRFLALRLSRNPGQKTNRYYGDILRLIAGGIFIIAGLLMYQGTGISAGGFFV
ncbi:nickel/cobalt transporter [Morganella morganii]|uniref:nickel/cobalt transporter n=1 Tax=Morganella morganii TaxID=582 RepID=UPI0031B3C2B5